MEFLQFNSLMRDLKIVRWIEGAGAIISSLLCVMFFAIAAGYEESLPKNASGPGYNLFEFLAVAHVIMCSGFAILLIFGFFRRTFITLLFEVPFLALLTLQLLRIYNLRLEQWPDWIEQYSRALVNFSYIDILLVPIVLALWIFFAYSWFQVIRKGKRNMSAEQSSSEYGSSV